MEEKITPKAAPRHSRTEASTGDLMSTASWFTIPDRHRSNLGGDSGPRSAVRADFARRWAIRLSCAYLALALCLWFLLLHGDDWWLGTLVLFGPRWVAATPLVILVPWAAAARSLRAGAVLAVAAFVVAAPLTGGTVNFASGLQASPTSDRLRILTCNNHGKMLDVVAFRHMVFETMPDIVFLQDVNSKVTADDFPANWYSADGPANLRVWSRFPIHPVATVTGNEFGRGRGAARYWLDTPAGPLNIVNVHLPTPRFGLEPVLHHQSDAVDKLSSMVEFRDHASLFARAWIGSPSDNTIIAGDFNIPPESVIYERDWKQYHNAFSEGGNGWGLTMHARWSSVRIDHILFTSPWRCRTAWVGPDVGSAHRPVVADLELEAP